MTRVVLHRCAHCSVEYSYQSSGHGASDLNHDRYCRDCYAVVREALKTVPRRVEKDFELVTDAEVVAKVIAEHERLCADPPRLFDKEGPPIRQITSGMCKLDPTTRNVVASSHGYVIHLDHIEYHLELWSDATPPKVTRAIQRDLKTGMVKPWRNLDR